MLTHLTRYNQLTTELNLRAGKLQAAQEDLVDIKEKLDVTNRNFKLLGEVCDVLRIVGELLRERIKKRIENLVTMALRSVFDRPDYKFKLDMKLSRGQMTAQPMLASDFNGKEIEMPLMDGHGGGLVNVASFVLQTIVLVLTRPKLARVLILDEPFANVSRQFLPKVAELMQKLREVTGVQFVLVTHKGEFVEVADKVFDVKKIDGKTEITERK